MTSIKIKDEVLEGRRLNAEVGDLITTRKALRLDKDAKFIIEAVDPEFEASVKNKTWWTTIDPNQAIIYLGPNKKGDESIFVPEFGTCRIDDHQE